MALRIVAWDTALMDYVTSVLDEPFEWGRTDCASLVIGATRAMFGRDVLKPGTWQTKRGALGTLSRIGSYRDFLARAGAVNIPLAFRQRGDIALLPDLDDEGFPGLGIVMQYGVLTVGPDELVQICPVEPDTVIVRLTDG